MNLGFLSKIPVVVFLLQQSTSWRQSESTRCMQYLLLPQKSAPYDYSRMTGMTDAIRSAAIE